MGKILDVNRLKLISDNKEEEDEKALEEKSKNPFKCWHSSWKRANNWMRR